MATSFCQLVGSVQPEQLKSSAGAQHRARTALLPEGLYVSVQQSPAPPGSPCRARLWLRPPGLPPPHPWVCRMLSAARGGGESSPPCSQLEIGWSHVVSIHSPLRSVGTWIKLAAQAWFWLLRTTTGEVQVPGADGAPREGTGNSGGKRCCSAGHSPSQRGKRLLCPGTQPGKCCRALPIPADLAWRGLLPLCLDVVSNHPPVICGQEDVIVSGAVIVAGAHLDEHHLPLEEVPFGAAELHLHGAGGIGGAAAAVRAAAAEPGPVGTGAGAARKLEVQALAWLWGAYTLLPLLGREQRS